MTLDQGGLFDTVGVSTRTRFLEFPDTPDHGPWRSGEIEPSRLPIT
jgi:hypothetical protein